MNRCIILAVIFGVSVSASVLNAGYGDQVNGFPSQQERELHLATNVVRTAPQQFRETYIGNYDILLPENYPAVNPIYLHADLNHAGRAHAEDMADTCGLSHDSCDGTEWETRIRSYYSDGGGIAENLATGRPTGFQTVIQLLRDDVAIDSPAGDNSEEDGHRANIMNNGYQNFGPGYAYTPSRQWYHFWVQDFGSAQHAYYAISSGSHLYLLNNTISLMATFYDPDGNAPQSTRVIINGVSHALSHHLGTTARGTYRLDLPDDNNCRNYYFEFVSSDGITWRYPETTELSNNPGQTCYIPPRLSDAIRALQVVSNSLPEGEAAEIMNDINGDWKIGLAGAIFVLQTLSDF